MQRYILFRYDQRNNQKSFGWYTLKTFSVASCILSADAALKAAAVEICELRVARGMGGKSYVALSGTVAAVTAGVEAGAKSAIDNGVLNDTVVIASPHEDLWQYLQ